MSFRMFGRGPGARSARRGSTPARLGGRSGHRAAGRGPGRELGGARLGAEIVYDTDNTGLPTGVRTFIQEGTRRLLFADGEYEVLFRIAPAAAPDAFSFVGQVLHGGLPLGAAPVRHADDGAVCVTDQMGGFRLPSLATGPHRFEVATRDGVIELAPITVGPGADAAPESRERFMDRRSRKPARRSLLGRLGAVP